MRRIAILVVTAALTVAFSVSVVPAQQPQHQHEKYAQRMQSAK